MIGKLVLAKSGSQWRGLRRGYRIAGRSFLRRFYLALFIWCLLIGSGIGFLGESDNIFLHLTSGESMKVKVISKWPGYFRVHPKYPKEER